MSDEELKNTDTSDTSSDRGDRDRSDRGGERELSGGRRDRSREMLREEIERNFDSESRRAGGRKDFEPADRPARAAREATTDAKDRGQQTAVGGAGAAAQGAGQVDTTSAPKSWRADERAHYDQLPPEIKNAVHRREQEMERGVAELKQRYSEIDAALAPSMEVIRADGHTAGRAISQMFNWFNHLSRNPAEAFPQLVATIPGAREALLQQAQRQQQQAGAQAQQTNGGAQQFDPGVVQQYVDQRVGTLEQQMMDQQQARTNEILENWARGKKYYERVRVMMSQLLQPNQYGQSVIPLKNGSVDLDGAYTYACRLLPDVFAEVQAEERGAERKAQREQAEKARRSSGSLVPGAPGSGSSTSPKKRSGAKSVRDSINEAMLEIRDA